MLASTKQAPNKYPAQPEAVNLRGGGFWAQQAPIDKHHLVLSGWMVQRQFVSIKMELKPSVLEQKPRAKIKHAIENLIYVSKC